MLVMTKSWWWIVAYEKVSLFVIYDFENNLICPSSSGDHGPERNYKPRSLGNDSSIFTQIVVQSKKCHFSLWQRRDYSNIFKKMVLPRDCRTNSMKKSPKPIMSFVQCDLIIIHQRVEAKSWNPSATQSTRALLSSSRGTSYQTCLQVWWVITDNSIRQWWLRWHSWLWESTIINDNADNQCFQSLVFFYFRSHRQPHSGADPCLCRGYFQK